MGGERERNIDVREKHRLVASWYVPQPGIKLTTFLAFGIMLQPTEPPDHGQIFSLPLSCQ